MISEKKTLMIGFITPTMWLLVALHTGQHASIPDYFHIEIALIHFYME